MARSEVRQELCIPRHDRPCNAGNLVSECYRDKFERLLRQQFTRPVRQRRISPALLHPIEGCMRADHEELAQGPIAHFGNGTQPWFSRSNAVSERGQANPSPGRSG
jgi:hypothetical protein